ncbi:MAG: hypothetical protein HY741_22285, partial [Chloroflexi bacterium]|nr:hypothetical protein [Chloroflexota bacterium]
QTNEAVRGLAQAQARTEQRVEQLAQAQVQTTEAVRVLTQAQARTDERLTRVEEAVEKLTQAQIRTEERVVRLEAAIEKLVQAQVRTEEALRELRVTVGGLANDFGLSLEEVTAGWLPIYLDHHFNIKYLTLTRISFKTSGSELAEVDLAGVGKQDGAQILVLSEVRASIGGGEVARIADKLADVEANQTRPTFKAIVAMRIHPTAADVAREKGIELLPYSRISREPV